MGENRGRVRFLQLGEGDNIGGLDIIIELPNLLLEIINRDLSINNVAHDNNLLQSIGHRLQLSVLPLQTLHLDRTDLILQGLEVGFGVPRLNIKDDNGLSDDNLSLGSLGGGSGISDPLDLSLVLLIIIIITEAVEVIIIILSLLLSSGGGLLSSRGGGSGDGGSSGGITSNRGVAGLLVTSKGEGANNIGNLLLVEDGDEPTADVLEGLPQLTVEDSTESTEEGGGNDDIGKSDSLTNQEGLGLEGLVEGRQQLPGVGRGSLDEGGVGGELTLSSPDPGVDGGLELGGGEGDPGVNLGSLDGRAAEQRSGVSVLLGDKASNGVALEQGTSLGLEDGDLLQRASLDRVTFLVTRDNLNLNLNLGEGGGDEDLLGEVASLRGFQSLEKKKVSMEKKKKKVQWKKKKKKKKNWEKSKKKSPIFLDFARTKNRKENMRKKRTNQGHFFKFDEHERAASKRTKDDEKKKKRKVTSDVWKDLKFTFRLYPQSTKECHCFQFKSNLQIFQRLILLQTIA